MRTRIKNIEECTKLLQIEIPPDLVDKTTKEVYQNIKKVAKVPGFRPGNTPQDLLEKHYRKTAEEEVLKILIPEGYKKAVEDHKIVPVGMPEVFNVNLEKNKPLTFEARVDTRPAVKLKNYKGFRVVKTRISVSREEVDETLLRLRNMYAKYKDAEGCVKKGDYAISDVEAFIDDKPITKLNKNMWILADKEASLLGMGEDLIGASKGQTKEIDTKLPENYPDKKYAGKAAKFKIAVNEIKEKELPVLDDAFAKNLNSQDMDSLKKEIETQLFARKEKDLTINMKNQILEKLLKDNKFSVPASLVKRQKEVFAKRLEMDLSEKGVAKEEAEKKIKELDKKLEEDAKDKIRIYFILDEIAEKEKIEVNKKDIDARLSQIALSTGRPQEEVRSYYEKENLLGGLGEEIKEDKALEFLLKNAEITEGK
ncbi:MAG: trigger factor [Candidatus Omnitrophica bacterium]|nr:trigger factor [Candidatus Omnitrophota bacterium]